MFAERTVHFPLVGRNSSVLIDFCADTCCGCAEVAQIFFNIVNQVCRKIGNDNRLTVLQFEFGVTSIKFNTTLNIVAVSIFGWVNLRDAVVRERDHKLECRFSLRLNFAFNSLCHRECSERSCVREDNRGTTRRRRFC